jgi:hypothetical protein
MLENRKLYRWDPQGAAKWEKERSKGQFHFMLFYGILKIGMCIFVFLAGFDYISDQIRYGHFGGSFDYKGLIVKGIIAVIFGLIRSGIEWNCRELSYEKYIKPELCTKRLL